MIDHSSRDHALLSASSAHRWLACPPSAVAAELYPNEDTEFTREGTQAHEVAEMLAQGCGRHIPREDGYPVEMIECASGYADYIQEQIHSSDAVIMLEQRVDFSPWVPEGFGTCDCIILHGDTLTIIDYKYGQGVAVSAEGNPQMKLYALGALNDYGIAYDVKHVEMHIYQPRINNISKAELSVDELITWAETEVKPTAVLAFEGKGEYSAGEHCRFCPHSGRCKALADTCKKEVDFLGRLVTIPMLSMYELSEILQMEPLITMWLKKIKGQALSAMLSGEQIPGYKVVEGKLGNRKWTNELNVMAALTAAGIDRSTFTETKLLSPAAMDKALGKKRAAELLSDYIDRTAGAPTIAPITDKRAAYSPADDFTDLGG